MLFLRRPAFAVALLVGVLVGVAPSAAALFQPGATTMKPVMTSAAAPERHALIVVPGFSGGGDLRGAVAQSDAAAYRDMLRLLGFAVTIVAVDTRPTLDLESRNFAAGVKRDGDVAVFVLGSVIGADGKLYVPGADLPAGARTPERVATESLDLAELLRRIQGGSPRQLVAIVDECGAGETQPTCPTGALPENVILAHRLPPRGDGMPQAGIASLRGELLALMQEPDLSFIKLFERLKGRLDGTNDTIVASAALSRDFTFLPGDFLAKLPTACNEVDAGLSAEALKAAPSLAPLVPACERAAQTWAFSPYFKDRLATAREQLAFQTAMAGCDDAAADAYLGAYPNGAYRFAANDHKAECARRREPPPPAPVPLAPPVVQEAPAAQEPSLQQRAYDAVVEYYQKHDYSNGGDMSGLATIYPSSFDRHGTPVERDVHLRELMRFYAPYANFTFNVLSSTLDYSGCGDASFCLMRGIAQRTSRKLNDAATSSGRLRFSLRFDLTRGTRVLSECAMIEGRPTKEKPCD